MSWSTNILRVCALALAGLAATFATVQLRGGYTVEFFRDASPLPRIVQGFARPSEFEDETGAAVREQAYLRLRRLSRAAPWRAEFLARSSSSTRPSELVVTVDDVEALRTTLASEWTPVTVEVPTAPRPGAVLGFRPAADGRRIVPVVVGDIALRSTSWARLNLATVVATLVCALAIGLLVAVAGWEVRALAAGLAAIAVAAIVLTRGLATEGQYAAWAAWWTSAIAAAGAAAVVAVRRWSAAPDAWTTAIVLSAAATVIHGLVLGHPLMGIGDSLFHLHRFQSVDDGRYFMTSEAPGGEFPYPIAFYVIAKGIAALFPFDDMRWMLRAVCVIAHAGAGLALFGLVLRWRSAAQAGWALLLFLVVPVGFHTQGVAYLTNSFGQSFSVVALCLGGLWSFGRRRWLGAALITAAAAIAFLSHLGSFMLLGVSLGLFAGACLAIARFREAGKVVALSTLWAAILSVILFYAWFGDTYRALLARPVTPAAAAESDAPPPVMRREAHQTQFVPGLPALVVRLAALPRYVNRYFGWWLLPLAVLGAIAARQRPRDLLSLLVFAWIAAGAAFFLLGHLSSIDVRYYLGTYPALAILASEALSSARPWMLWTGRALAAAGALSAMTYCLQWLGHWP